MKRTITAVVFATLAAPVLAADLPFEQTELNRVLPNVRERADRVEARDAKQGFTFEQYNPA